MMKNMISKKSNQKGAHWVRCKRFQIATNAFTELHTYQAFPPGLLWNILRSWQFHTYKNVKKSIHQSCSYLKINTRKKFDLKNVLLRFHVL